LSVRWRIAAVRRAQHDEPGALPRRRAVQEVLRASGCVAAQRDSMRQRMAASIVEHLAQRLNWVATPVVMPTAGNT